MLRIRPHPNFELLPALAPVAIATLVLALSGLLVAACSGGTPVTNRARSHGPTTSLPPPAPPPATTTTTVEITTTTAAGFPSVIVQAMREFSSIPVGARAPATLPATAGFVTAETGGLGGQVNVTLIATTSPMAVGSPALTSSGAGRELASFSTTPTASTSNAATELAGDRARTQASCQGATAPLSLADGTAGSTCSTIQGEVVDWMLGSWAVQVLSLSGQSPPTDEANRLEAQVGRAAPPTTELPASDAGGILSVVVPGTASAGSTDTAALEWTVGADLYQVRSGDDPGAALEVAAAMRPYPG